MKIAAILFLSAIITERATLTAGELPPVAVPSATFKEESLIVKPAIKEKEFIAPTFRPPVVALPPEQRFEVVDHTTEVVTRLQRAAKEVRHLEVWSLDPSVPFRKEADPKNEPYRFHDFLVLGKEELKGKEKAQRLILSATLSIAKGPDETADCFVPRHGLRIYDQKGFLDVLLCYTCLQGVLYDGKKQLWFATSKEAEPEFDSVFLDLKLKKAE